MKSSTEKSQSKKENNGEYVNPQGVRFTAVETAKEGKLRYFSQMFHTRVRFLVISLVFPKAIYWKGHSFYVVVNHFVYITKILTRRVDKVLLNF